jgi:hypothetical protein
VSEGRRFGWDACADVVGDALAAWPGPEPVADARGRAFDAVDEETRRRIRVEPPLVLAAPSPGQRLSDWLEEASAPLGRQVVVLIQAGAAALGLFEDGELVRHRTLKRYVVRGSGRAQPAYLKTRGKSRAGSRLRLRNAKRLLEDVAATLMEWSGPEEPFDRVFRSCPVRTWAELLRESLPFDASGPLSRIPLDLRRPSHEEMKRAWRTLARGRIVEEELSDDAGGDAPLP